MPGDPSKEGFDRWLKEHAAGTGLLGAGIVHRDRSCNSHSHSDGYPTADLDAAWACLAETTKTLRLCRVQPYRMRWTFEQAQIQFVLRPDGTALGLITAACLTPPAPEWVESLIQGFLQL